MKRNAHKLFSSCLLSFALLTIPIWAVSVADPFEPNDSPEQATDLGAGIGTRLSGLRSGPDDDFYRFRVLRADTLRLGIAFAHAEGDLTLSLHDADGPLAESATTSDEELIETPLAAGTYVLQVSGENSAYGLTLLPGAGSSTRLLYVNDGSQANDRFCTAAGAAENDGLSPATPVDSVQALLRSQTVGTTDVCLLDAGSYSMPVFLPAGLQGTVFVGVPSRTLTDRSWILAGTSQCHLYGLTFSGVPVALQLLSGANNNTLERLSFSGCGTAILSEGGGNQITFCQAVGPGTMAIQLTGPADLVSDCHVADYGVGIALAAGCEVRRTVITGCSIGVTAASANVSQSRFLENEIGIDCVGQSILQHNVVAHSTKVGIRAALDLPGKVEGNVIHDSGSIGISIAGGTETAVCGNTLYEPQALGIRALAGAASVVGNIVVTEGRALLEIHPPAQASFSGRHNLYFGPFWRWGSTVATSLMEWEATAGSTTDSLFADPQFADLANRDLHVRSQQGRFTGELAPLLDSQTGLPVLSVPMAVAADAEHSPGIDRAGISDAWQNEPGPNGAYRNLGAYGNTDQASLSLAEFVVVTRPDGSERPAAGDPIEIRWRTHAGDNGTAYRNAVLGSNPIAYWRLADGSDASGNGHDATFRGDPVHVPGVAQPDLATRFDGNDDCLVVPNHPDLAPSQIALEAWIRPSSNTEIGDVLLAYSSDPSAIDGYGLYFGGPTFGTAENVFFYVNARNNSLGTTISHDVWTHVVATYNGAHMRLYFNGSRVSERAYSQPLVPPPAASLFIGCHDSASAHYEGGLDEVALYDRTDISWGAHVTAQPATVRIELLTPAGSVAATIGNAVPNDGLLSWLPNGIAPDDYRVRITHNGAGVVGTSASFPYGFPSLALSIAPTELDETQGAAAAIAQVSRPDTTGDLVVSLSSSPQNALSFPQTVTILDGESSATFAIDASVTPAAEGERVVTFSASAGGHIGATGSVSVFDEGAEPFLIQQARPGNAQGLESDAVTIPGPIPVHEDESKLFSLTPGGGVGDLTFVWEIEGIGAVATGSEFAFFPGFEFVSGCHQDRVVSVRCLATDARGQAVMATWQQVRVIEVGRHPPAPVLQVNPVHSRTTDDLVVQIEPVHDPDPGAEISGYDVVWTLIGSARQAFTGPVLAAEHTQRGNRWEVAVTPISTCGGVSVLGQNRATARIEVANSAPSGIPPAPVRIGTNESVDVYLAASDPDVNDGNDQLVYRIATPPANGQLLVIDGADGHVRYTPTEHFSGQDSFTFVATDLEGAESTPVPVSVVISGWVLALDVANA